MEAAILEKTTETRSEDLPLFCEISCFVLTERPLLKDIAKSAKKTASPYARQITSESGTCMQKLQKWVLDFELILTNLVWIY